MVIRNASEISGAIEYVEKEISVRQDNREKYICSLICEELLMLLLSRGFSEISLSKKGFISPQVEVEAKGEKLDLDTPLSVIEAGDLDAQIRQKLLMQYADQIVYSFKENKEDPESGGLNRYRIKCHKVYSPDLRSEIYDYYSDPEKNEGKKSYYVLLHIARNHPVQVITAILNKSVKHLAALMLSVFTSSIIDTLTETGDFFSSNVILYIIASFIALFINLTCFGLDAVFYHRFTRAVETGFKMALVQKLQDLSVKYHNSTQSGMLLSKMVSDVQFIQMLIYNHLEAVLHLTVDIIFLSVVALIKYPPMLLFYLIIVPASLFVGNSFSKNFLKSRKQMRKQIERSNAAFKEMLDMKEITRSHGLQRLEYQDISEKVERAQRASSRYDLISINVNNVSFGGYHTFRLICLCVSGFLFTKGYITVGTLVLFQSLFETIINSLQNVVDKMPDIIQGCDSLISVDEILREKDIESNGTLPPAQPVRGELELKNVVFSYDEGGKKVLDGLTLHIPALSCAAFFGASGEGKSTLVNLILGLYEKQSGEILIDGIDIDELDKHQYRRLVAVVPQTPVLFDGTLWDNLTYGIPFITSEQVLTVLKDVGLEELVNSLPDGLNSMVFEGGVNFSGGQRQRIAIARAMLRDAKIVFFDEATSALDSESEAQVQQAIDSVMGKCTVIMIAHRLNTLKNADQIYRIMDGKAVPATLDDV